MKLLVVHLRRTEYLDDLLLALTQVGVHDPAVIEALGGQSRMLAQVPIFAGFLGGGKRSEFHRIVLAVTEDADVADRIIAALADGGIDWKAEGLGAISVLPLEKWISS